MMAGGDLLWSALALLVSSLMLAGCQAPPASAPCAVYGHYRADMPRPLPEDALGQWVAVVDSAMTGACR